MKIRCEKKDLQTAVSVVSRAAPSKSPIPALEGILFETEEDGLKLTAFDTKIGIYTSIPSSVLEEGSIVLPAKFLNDLTRRLPDGMVSIESDSSLKTKITCGKTELQVMSLSPEEFPALSVVNPYRHFRIPQNMLKSMINQTIFSVSTSESRPVYMGELFEISEEELTVVAIDGYRMALRREKIENSEGETGSFILPGTSLSEVEKICSAEKEDEAVISLGEKHASFAIGDTVLITRRLEGEFMNYRKSIPGSFRHEILVEREELMRVIDRVSIVIKDKQSSPVKMLLEEDMIHFSCTTSFGHAEDSCLCSGSGDGMRIGFNDRYLMDALRAAEGEKLRLMLNTPSAPIIIQAEKEDRFLYMVLPVRLRESD